MCVHGCVYIHVHVCAYLCVIHTCIYMVFVCTGTVNVYVLVLVVIACVCVCALVCVCVCVCVYVCVLNLQWYSQCVRVYIYTCIYMYIYNDYGTLSIFTCVFPHTVNLDTLTRASIMMTPPPLRRGNGMQAQAPAAGGGMMMAWPAGPGSKEDVRDWTGKPMFLYTV